jgi:hypothetical protein
MNSFSSHLHAQISFLAGIPMLGSSLLPEEVDSTTSVQAQAVQPDSMVSLRHSHSRVDDHTNFPVRGALGEGLNHGCNLGSVDLDF